MNGPLRWFIFTSAIAVSSLSATTVLGPSVTVGGKVNYSGPVPFKEGLTLAEAIQTAGGTSKFAARNRVVLNRSGKRIELDLAKDQTKKLKLKNGDTILVPAMSPFEWPSGKW